MRRISPLVVMVLLAGAAAEAEMVTARWGNGPNVQNAKTAKYEGGTLSFDLSALPKDAKVYAARLFMPPVRWSDPSFDLVASGGEPIKLVGPDFLWYDATAATRAWVKAGAGSVQVRKGPRVKSDAVVLEIAYEGRPAGELPRQVADVEALCRSGQVFITFKEMEPPDGGKDEVTWADLAGKFRGDFYGPMPDPEGGKQIVYRVYSHDQPITAQTIGRASLVAEVLPGSALNTRMSLVVDPAKKTRQMAAANGTDAGGPAAREAKKSRQTAAANPGRKRENLVVGPQVFMVRSAVEPGKPVEPGTGICVHTVTREGKAYYAVLTALNGVVNAKDISAANAVGPIEQKRGEPEPVMYKEFTTPVGGGKYVEQWYSYWTVPPLSPWPARYDVFVGYRPDLLAKPAPLYLLRGSYETWPRQLRPERTAKLVNLVMSHTGDEPLDMGVGEFESMRSQKGATDGRFIAGFPNRQDALVRWMKSKWSVDANRISAHLGDWGMQELKRGDTYCLLRGWGLPEYTKGWQTWQRAVGEWGPPSMYQGRPDDENPYALSDLTDYVLANPAKELPFLIMYARGGSHFAEMGWPPVPRFLAAMEKTKRAFIYGGKRSPAEAAINSGQIQLRLDLSVPAFAHSSLDDNPGEGERRSGENFAALLNGFVLWDSASIADEPRAYQITLWVDDSCCYPDGWVDMTPRRCQKFKAKPGEKFAWTNTLIEEPPAPGAAAEKTGKSPAKPGKAAPAAAPARPAAGKLIQSGTATADENGLVTIEKLGLSKGKHRIEIKAK